MAFEESFFSLQNFCINAESKFLSSCRIQSEHFLLKTGFSVSWALVIVAWVPIRAKRGIWKHLDNHGHFIGFHSSIGSYYITKLYLVLSSSDQNDRWTRVRGGSRQTQDVLNIGQLLLNHYSSSLPGMRCVSVLGLVWVTSSTKALEALQGIDNRSPALDSGQHSKWSQCRGQRSSGTIFRCCRNAKWWFHFK